MATVVITCQTIRREVCLAVSETGVDYPLILIDSGLHNYPEKLREAIQKQIDKITNVDTILMAFGFCGNGLLGIKSPEARLVIPRADDCITLMLGSLETRKKISKEAGTYFLTKGWLDYEANLLTEYENCVKKYGREKALRVMKIMLGHYQRLMVIDTKAYRLEDVTGVTRVFAETVGMRHEEVAGSLRLIKKLLLGPWDEEFVIVEPGRELKFEQMCPGDNKQLVGGRDLFGLEA
jgi:hypothetical protein